MALHPSCGRLAYPRLRRHAGWVAADASLNEIIGLAAEMQWVLGGPARELYDFVKASCCRAQTERLCSVQEAVALCNSTAACEHCSPKRASAGGEATRPSGALADALIPRRLPGSWLSGA